MPLSKYTHSVHSLRLVLMSLHLRNTQKHKHTHTHKHTSQWCIACSGLAQSPLCPCIRCHSGSIVMSLCGCGPHTSCQADKAAHRHDWIRSYKGPTISGSCKQMNTCKNKKPVQAYIHKPSQMLEVLVYLTMASLCTAYTHTEQAVGQMAKVTAKSKSDAWGQADTAHQHQSIFHSCGTACPQPICLRPVKSRLNLSQDILKHK